MGEPGSWFPGPGPAGGGRNGADPPPVAVLRWSAAPHAAVLPRTQRKLVQSLRFREATAPAGSTNFQIAMKRYSFAAPFVPVFAYRVFASSARCLDISQPARTIATPKIIKPHAPMTFSDRKLATDPTPTMSA